VKRSPVQGLVLDPVCESLVSSAGGLLLQQTIRACGVDQTLSAALAPWRSERAKHDPAKVLLVVATAVPLGGTVWPMLRLSGPSRSRSGWSPTRRRCPA
jgi:hypothetical protein